LYKILNNTRAEECPVKVKAGKVTLDGSLCIPPRVKGVVLFAHGSGSSRLSPRNKFVAHVLQNSDIGTLLFDLLTREEEIVDDRTAKFRFDIKLLSKRLVEATDWLLDYLGAENAKIGYFGASTGAAAALIAAAERPQIVQTVVSRGGRPDLAAAALPKVKAATLLLVGGDDTEVIEMNKEALAKLKSEKSLVIIPGATHLFEEPGALEQVARLASDWFLKYFSTKSE
jgi:putative phosphoribosyl transferase